MLPLKVRSMVGLIPLFAVETLDPQAAEQAARVQAAPGVVPELSAGSGRLVSRWQEPGSGERHLLSLLRGSRMKKLLKRMLDETEFLSDYGVRAVSAYHKRPSLFVPLERAVDGRGL